MLGYYAPTLLFLAGSIYGLFFSPKEINPYMGYRTLKSMKNKENWTFAQKYAAKLLFKGCLLILILQVLVQFFIIHSIFYKEYILVVLGLNLLVVAYTVYQTEKKLN